MLGKREKGEKQIQRFANFIAYRVNKLANTIRTIQSASYLHLRLFVAELLVGFEILNKLEASDWSK